MKALRIVINQSSANYKREEVVLNRMTYPLPPISTVIGALHSACNYKEYHLMDISIQGKFESLNREIYTDTCFHNRIEDDRAMLVKMRNERLLSNAYDRVAKAKKNQGNSFLKGETIEVFNDDLLKEYRDLKELNDKIALYKKTEYKDKLNEYKVKKKELTDIKKSLDKKSQKYKDIDSELKQVKEDEIIFKQKVADYEKENYTDKISKFKLVTTSVRHSEELSNIKIILHIKSDEDTLRDIEENIYNLKCIGRAEDFVEVIDCKLVDLIEDDDCEVTSEYSAYLNFNDVKEENIYFDNVEYEVDISGTKYYLNKDYKIVDNKRIFNKVKVLYASDYFIEETSDNVLLDRDEEETYIVNFI